MTLKQLKPGDQIQHYCFGHLVEATVKEVKSNGYVITKHEPIRWSNNMVTESLVIPSSELQIWSGYAQTTPAAFYDNKPITL